MKAKVTLILLFVLSATASSQNLSIQGNVAEKITGKPLRNANILLFHLPDSTMLGTTSGRDGTFKFENQHKGKYGVKISYLGYQTIVKDIVLAEKSLNLSTLLLEEETISMQEIAIEAKAPPVQVNEDTTEFNAKSFKTNPDATAEDLVTKVPGVTVQGGKVQAQGEDVKKVLIDNKPFFGNDPTAALRNIPAELIDRVQIFDQQSERSQFTGFDDGNTSKTINLITRSGMRNGQFGKIFAGYGVDNDYKAGATFNYFNGDTRLTILTQTNNINEQNFAIEDILGASGGASRFGASGMRVMSTVMAVTSGRGMGFGGGRGGGDMSTFLVTPSGGITTTHALGLNYSDKWAEKMDVSASYFFNYSDNSANTNLFRQFIQTQNANQIYLETESASNTTWNHRFNLRLDWELDTLNSILFRPRFTLQETDGRSVLGGETFMTDVLLNTTNTTRTPNLMGLSISNELLYRHKFETKGRTLAIEASTDYTHNNGENYLLSSYVSFAQLALSDSLDQYAELNKNGVTLSSEMSYTEPIDQNSQLQFEYQISQLWNESDKHTFERLDPATAYSFMDTSLTNTYKSTYLTQAFETDYQLNDGELSFTAGAAYQWAQLNGDQTFPYMGSVGKSFTDVLPNLRLRWRQSREKNLSLFYRTRTNPPSIDNLQNVIDNSDPLQLRTGNPDLKQDYSHSLFLRYMSANLFEMKYFFTMLSGSYTNNSIANSTFIADRDTILDGGIALLRGGQLIKPVNIDGAYSLRGLVTYGFPVEFIKSNLNLSAFVNYSRSPGLINNELNYSQTPSLSGVAVISSNISPEIDFTISSFTTKNWVKYSLQEELNTSYLTQNTSVRLNWIIWEGIVLSSDLSNQYSTGLSEGYNQNSMLWNVGLGKKFLPNNAGELRFTVFDILNQNKNYQRTNTESYIDDFRTNTLQRYALLTFTYTLRSFGS